MLKYLLGLLKNLFNPAVPLSARVDDSSEVSRKSRLYAKVKFLSSRIGDCSYVGPDSVVAYTEIGKFCSIGPNCSIGLASHTMDYLSSSSVFTERKNGTGLCWVNESVVEPYRKTKIGHDVWIGNNVLILGGVTIGNGAVIGAGAVVTKNVPPYAVVGGVPAKLIKYRFPPERIEELQSLCWWDLPEEVLRAHLPLFQKVILPETNVSFQ